MAFSTSAESLRAKLHVSEVKTSALVGVCLASLIAVVLVIQSVVSIIDPPVAEIVRDDHAASVLEATESEDASAEEIFVYVTGAVAQPGMYGIAEGSRVQAALDSAKGFTQEADVSAINPARVAVDGEHIIVPTHAQTEAAAREPVTGTSGDQAGAAMYGAKVNINTADATLLDTLAGIGPSTAQKIIADRELNGPFASIEELKRVSGIGDKKYAELADAICVG